MKSTGGYNCKTTSKTCALYECQWRLCVFYQKLKHVTRTFDFLLHRCDDAVKEVNTEANYFIAVDMDSDY